MRVLTVLILLGVAIAAGWLIYFRYITSLEFDQQELAGRQYHLENYIKAVPKSEACEELARLKSIEHSSKDETISRFGRRKLLYKLAFKTRTKEYCVDGLLAGKLVRDVDCFSQEKLGAITTEQQLAFCVFRFENFR